MPCMCGDSECASCGCAQGTRAWTAEDVKQPRWLIRAQLPGSGGPVEIEVPTVEDAMKYHALLVKQGATQITSQMIP